MKRGVLVLLAMCCLASAMVPRERRAVDTETQAAQGKNGEKFCASHTPCGWTVYKKETNTPEMTIVNTYCICEEHLECVEDEEDNNSAFEHHCRARGSKSDKIAS